MRALQDIGLGLIVGLLIFGTVEGCGTATQLQCRVEAVKILPKDPKQITPYDLADVVTRIQTCENPPKGDAGSP